MNKQEKRELTELLDDLEKCLGYSVIKIQHMYFRDKLNDTLRKLKRLAEDK